MKFVKNWEKQQLLERPRTVFTVGVFDGLHLGHRYLIDTLMQQALKLKAQSLVLTFDRHPLEVLAPQAAPPLLSTLQQKTEILAGWGVDRLGLLHFDKSMAGIEPSKFLNQYIGKYIDPAGAVLGPDFSFGKDAKGNVGTVRRWFSLVKPRAQVITMEQLKSGSILYSSSQIRQNLKSGLVENAAEALGRPYRLEGKVVHGLARGRGLGFPTANLGDVVQLIPAPGAYAVYAIVEGIRYRGMTSIGYNPTFGEQPMTVETNIFDFDGFIYGYKISIEFIHHLRDMVRFKSSDELVAQLIKDKQRAIELLSC